MSNGSNTCVCCGVDIPEGAHTCNHCEQEYRSQPLSAEPVTEPIMSHDTWGISPINNIEANKLRAEIALVRQQNCVLVKSTEKLSAERDAAIKEIEHDCYKCTHWVQPDPKSDLDIPKICEECMTGSSNRCNFKWRGLPEPQTEQDKPSESSETEDKPNEL